MGKDTQNGITHHEKGRTNGITPWERTHKTASHTMGKDIHTASHRGKGHTNGITPWERTYKRHHTPWQIQYKPATAKMTKDIS
jgi:hypothetical protein